MVKVNWVIKGSRFQLVCVTVCVCVCVCVCVYMDVSCIAHSFLRHYHIMVTQDTVIEY